MHAEIPPATNDPTRSPAFLSARERFEVLALGRRVADDLAAEALDPTAALSMADRLALVALSLAVEAEAALRAGADPVTAEVIPALASALARVEREAVPIPSARAAGTHRGHHHAPA